MMVKARRPVAANGQKTRFDERAVVYSVIVVPDFRDVMYRGSGFTPPGYGFFMMS